MRHIQQVALDLFDDRGFQQVGVEEIAAAAQVSPSSVYRYFGTKEGIVLADDFDALSEAQLAELLDPGDLVGSVRAVVARFDPSAQDDAEAAELTRRRIGYFFDEPAVRKASYQTLAGAAERISRILAGSGNHTLVEARIAATALVFGNFTALEQWHRDPGRGTVTDTLEQTLAVLRRL